MTAFKELEHAYFTFRIENEVPDTEPLIIWVRPEFRKSVIADPEAVRGAYWQQTGGRFPVERFMGCPMQVDAKLDGNYKFERTDKLVGNVQINFLPDPSTGGA